MKDVIGPFVSGLFAFFLGYLGFRAKNKEVKVAESTGILKNYNDLIETYRTEIKWRDERIHELEEQLHTLKKEFSTERINMQRALRTRLREQE